MKKRNAFTIIEVVLVLAIAGLIFLMVFIALPALQRSQRNTRRRQDVARISSAVTTYYSNTGKMPFGKSTELGMRYRLDYDFLKNYIDNNIDASSAVANQNTVDFAVGCESGKTCEEFSDPNGSVYQVSLANASSSLSSDASNNMNKIFFNASRKCNADGTTMSISGGSAASIYSVVVVLEGGALYCADNS